MTFEQFARTVRDDRLPSLLLVHGEETYLVDQAVRLVIDTLVPPESRDFNLSVIHGRDVKAQTVIEQARTLPVFASRRLVVVRNIHESAAEQLDLLSAYLDEPVAETVLLATAAGIDKRRKFFQKFVQRGDVVEFRKLYDNQLPQFVRDRAKDAGRTFTASALKLFCRRIGTNLAEVTGELDKLFSYAGDQDFIEEADVAAVVSDTRAESIFALTDAIGTGETALALQRLNRLLSDGQPPLVILTMLTRHFRQLWKTRELLAQGTAQKELPRLIGINPYFLGGLLSQARLCSDARMRAAFPGLLAADLALKSGGDPRAHLERLVFALCAGAAAAKN